MGFCWVSVNISLSLSANQRPASLVYQPIRGQLHEALINQSPALSPFSQNQPIRGQYPGQVIPLDQSGASILPLHPDKEQGTIKEPGDQEVSKVERIFLLNCQTLVSLIIHETISREWWRIKSSEVSVCEDREAQTKSFSKVFQPTDPLSLKVTDKLYWPVFGIFPLKFLNFQQNSLKIKSLKMAWS